MEPLESFSHSVVFFFEATCKRVSNCSTPVIEHNTQHVLLACPEHCRNRNPGITSQKENKPAHLMYQPHKAWQRPHYLFGYVAVTLDNPALKREPLWGYVFQNILVAATATMTVITGKWLQALQTPGLYPVIKRNLRATAHQARLTNVRPRFLIFNLHGAVEIIRLAWFL